jgi:hypothetical protein
MQLAYSGRTFATIPDSDGDADALVAAVAEPGAGDTDGVCVTTAEDKLVDTPCEIDQH